MMSAVGSSQAKNASGDDHDGRVLLLPPQLQILDLNVYIFAKTRNHYKLSPEMVNHFLGLSCNHGNVRCWGC
jgi:hypothetical protein